VSDMIHGRRVTARTEKWRKGATRRELLSRRFTSRPTVIYWTTILSIWSWRADQSTDFINPCQIQSHKSASNTATSCC
jgi:hypothetical protein